MGDKPSPPPVGAAAAIRFAPGESADDDEFVGTLVDIVNRVYDETERDIFLAGYQRTSPSEVAGLIRQGQLAAVYEAGDEAGRPIGCVAIKLLSPTRGEFGMMAIDPAYRGAGYGNRLVAFAEEHCRRLGCDVMQLELLVPTTHRHAFKERIGAWYLRLGYKPVRVGQFNHDYPALAPLLAGPTEYRVFEKALPLGA